MAATDPDTNRVPWLIVLEALVVIAVAASQHGISVSQSLLRALLGQGQAAGTALQDSI